MSKNNTYDIGLFDPNSKFYTEGDFVRDQCGDYISEGYVAYGEFTVQNIIVYGWYVDTSESNTHSSNDRLTEEYTIIEYQRPKPIKSNKPPF